MIDREIVKKKLLELDQEHGELNEIIDNSSESELDEFTIQKIKKRKLLLKDQIKVLSSYLHDDIIA